MISKYKSISLITIMLFCYFAANSNGVFSPTKERIAEQWRWTRFGTYSGLPSNQILQIFEGSNGTIYAHTSNGMVWYDFFKWNVIPDNFNLPYNSIHDVSPDNNDGINIFYQGNLYNFSKYGSKIINQINLQTSSHVITYNDGYFSVVDERVKEKVNWYYIDNKSNFMLASKFLDFDESKNGDIQDVFITKNNNLWIFTFKNVYYIDNNKWKPVFKTNFRRISVRKVIEDNLNNAYLNIDYPKETAGIWVFNKITKDFKNIFPHSDNINSFSINLNDELFITDKLGNVRVYKEHKLIELNDPKTPDQIQGANKLLFTKSNLLITHNNSQIFLCRIGSSKWNYYDIPILNLLSVNAFNRDKSNNLYIASYQGLGVLQPNKKFKFLKSINGKSIEGLTSTLVDKNNNVWVSSGSTIDGVFKYNGKIWRHLGKKEGFPEVPIHKIKEDIYGNIWFLTISRDNYSKGSGAYKLKPNGEMEIFNKSNGLKSERVYDIIVEKDSTTWFSTVNGIFRLKDNKWKIWDYKSGINSLVYALCLDAEGKLWFGGGNNVFGYIYKDSVFYPDVFREYDITEVMQIEFDKHSNKLWISSKRGLFSFKNNVVTEFNKSNGLKTNNIWPILIEKDSILIGTNGLGLNVLNLQEENNPAPKIEIQNPNITKSNSILSWKVYSYLGIKQHDKIPIRFKLDNTEWSKWCFLREVTYNDLPYGNHTLQIQALSSFGIYDNKYTSIDFEIEKPPFLRPNFYLPFLGILLFALYNVLINIKKRKEALNQLRILNESLEQKVKEKTKDLEKLLADLEIEKEKTILALQDEKALNEIKSNFILMISHEYRTPLTVILTSTYLIETAILKNKYEIINSNLERIQKSVQILTKFVDDSLQINSVKNEISFSKNEDLQLYPFLESIISNYLDFENKSINIELNCNEEINIFSNSNNISLVINNLILNAIRYSKPNKAIKVNVFQDNEHTIIEVIDEGIGIKKEDINNIFNPFFRAKNVIGLITGTGLGLSISQKAAQDLNGKLLVESEFGVGTKFSLVLKN